MWNAQIPNKKEDMFIYYIFFACIFIKSKFTFYVTFDQISEEGLLLKTEQNQNKLYPLPKRNDREK